MIDFSEQNLDDMDFGGIDLSGSIFNRSSLKRAQFIGGTYRDTDFEDLQSDALEDTKFLFSDFSGASFRDYYGAQAVTFGDTDLSGSSFRDFVVPISLEGCHSDTIHLDDTSGKITVERGSHNKIVVVSGDHDDSVFENTSVTLDLTSVAMRRATVRNSAYHIESRLGDIEDLELDQSKGTLNRVGDLTDLRSLVVKGGDLNLLSSGLNGFLFGDKCWIRFSKPTRNFESGKMGSGKYTFLNKEIYFERVQCEDADLLGKGVQFLNFTNSKLTSSTFVRFSIADGTTFYKCDFKDVSFYKCDLGRASFVDCRFKNVDFTTSNTSDVTMTRCQRNGVRGL